LDTNFTTFLPFFADNIVAAATTEDDDEIEEAEPMEISPEFEQVLDNTELAQTLSSMAAQFEFESEEKQPRKGRKSAHTLRTDFFEPETPTTDTESHSPILPAKRKYTPRGTLKVLKLEKTRSPRKREIKRKSLEPNFLPETLKKSSPTSKLKLKKKPGRKPQYVDPLKTSELSDNDDFCSICRDGGDDLLCCDSCPKVCHPSCHIPTLTGIPEGDFCCNLCKAKGDACDCEKQDGKHFRGEDGIHRDPTEFFKGRS
jgi:hypothetical protein